MLIDRNSEDDRVEPAPRRELSEVEGGEEKRASGWKPLAIQAVVSLIVSFALLMVWAMPKMVLKDDFTKNFQGISSDISGLKTSVTTLNSGLGTQIAQINSNISTLTNEVNKLQSSAGQYATSNQISTLQSNISTMQAELAKFKVVSDEIKDLAKLLEDFKTKLTAQETLLNSMKTTVDGLSANKTASGLVVGQVTTNVTGNVWSGSQLVRFSAITANTTASQVFTFQINNGLGKTINNVQLAIGLQLLQENTSILSNGLPSGVSVSLTSSGIMWQSQSTGYAYVLGFSNVVSTGIFGGIGAINQSAGTTSYDVTVTVVNSTNSTVPLFNIFPIIKVVNYSS